MLEYTTTITFKAGAYIAQVNSVKQTNPPVYITKPYSTQAAALKEATDFIVSRSSSVPQSTPREVKVPELLNTVTYVSNSGTIPVNQRNRCCGR